MKLFPLISVLVALAMVCIAQPLLEMEETDDSSVQTTTEPRSPTVHEAYEEYAKTAGLKDEQLIPTADLLLALDIGQGAGYQKAMVADHCKMLNDDGVMLEIDNVDTPKQKWSDLSGANMTTKIDYLWEITKSDRKVDIVKALKNICVLFSNPEERKKIEEWAREAGIQEEEIPIAVDIEMRIQMTNKIRERDDIMVKHLDDLGKNQYMLRIATLNTEEKEKLKSLSTEDYVENAVFWAGIYDRSTGADHIRALKNVFVVAYPGKPTPKKQYKVVYNTFSVPLNYGLFSIQPVFA